MDTEQPASNEQVAPLIHKEIAALVADFFNSLPIAALKKVRPEIALRIGDLMVDNGYRIVFNRWYLQEEPRAAHEPSEVRDIEPLVNALIQAVKAERDEFNERDNESYSSEAIMLQKQRVAHCKAALLAAAHQSAPPAALNVAPIARVEIIGGEVSQTEIYAPGLPDGAHDLFPVPLERASQPPDERLAALELELATIKKYARQCDLDAAAHELIEIEDRASATKTVVCERCRATKADDCYFAEDPPANCAHRPAVETSGGQP